MTKNIKLAIGAVVVIGIVLALFLSLAGEGEPGNGGKRVQVATNIPITGKFSIWGTSIREGGRMALADLESNGNGQPEIDITWGDNGSDAQNAVTLMQKHYLSDPDVYVSGIKPQCMAIKEQITEKGTPHFVWIFDPFINRNSENNFRTLVNYRIEAPVFVNYARAKRASRVAILYANLPHAEEEFRELVIPELKEMGAEVFSQAYPVTTKDYKNLGVKVKRFGPDLIILNGFQNTLVGLVRALRPLGLIANGNTIGTYDMIDAGEVLGPEEAEGIRVVAPYFESRSKRQKVIDWKNRFRKRYDKDPLYIHAFAYDMIQVIYDAAQRVQRPASSDDWIDAIQKTEGKGITGSLSFDEDGNLDTPVEVAVFRDGTLVPEEDFTGMPE